jgi:surfactin synthase thioesterase subunit
VCGRAPVHLFVSGRRGPQLPVRLPPSLSPGMSDEELIEALGRLEGTPAGLLRDRDAMRVFLPTLRADLQMAASYVHRPGDLLACGVTTLTGSADSEATADEMAGWAAHTRGSCSQHVIPGGHFFIHAEQRRVLRVLQTTLAALVPPALLAPDTTRQLL